MEWKSAFVVYRLNIESTLEEVYHCDDLKKAKYWLTYIAQPGDLLCRTPVHPKHSQKSKAAEYLQHKDRGGQCTTDTEKWNEQARAKGFDFKFPEEQLKAPDL
jgi:hypothetical protein